MKLIKCYVSSFGKLRDFEYDFDGGVNTIKQDNGWGKSTFATFIKAMFYGLNDGKRSVAENERTRFKPWNGSGPFGGYVIFEWKGKQFKIERFFGNKAAEDSVKIFDMETGRESNRTEDLGKRIFRIDEEGFLSTTYFSQKDFEIKSNTSITAKYNEVCEVQDTEKFDKALTLLDSKAKELKMRGDKGKIADTKREITLITSKIERANNAHLNAKALKADIESLERELTLLSEKDALLRRRATEAGKVEALTLKKQSYDKALNKRGELLEEIKPHKSLLNGKTVDGEVLANFDACVKEINDVSSKKEILRKDIETLSQAVPKDEPKRKGKTPVIIAIALAAIFAVLAVVGFIIPVIPLGIVGAALFVAAIVVAVILAKGGKPVEKDNSVNILLESKVNEYNSYEQTEKQAVYQLNQFLSGFNLPGGLSYGECSNKIKQAHNEILRINKEITQVSGEINELEKQGDIFKPIAKTVDTSGLEAEINSVGNEYKQKSQILAAKQAGVKDYLAEADSLADLESKKSELMAAVADYSEKYELYVKTMEFLEQADENLKVRYRKPLTDSLNKYLQYIAGSGISAEIDVDLKVTINVSGSEKDVDYFSKGLKNLFEICKRFALTDVLFTDEKPFIILDDPFYNLDDKKIAAALELIKNLEKEYQILYLVCHESRAV